MVKKYLSEFEQEFKFVSKLCYKLWFKSKNAFINNGFDLNDLKQECWIKAYEIYLKKKDTMELNDLKKFVNTSVYNHIINLNNKSYYNLKHSSIYDFSELNGEDNRGCLNENEEYHDDNTGEIFSNDIWDVAKKRLTNDEYTLICYYYKNKVTLDQCCIEKEKLLTKLCGKKPDKNKTSYILLKIVNKIKEAINEDFNQR